MLHSITSCNQVVSLSLISDLASFCCVFTVYLTRNWGPWLSSQHTGLKDYGYQVEPLGRKLGHSYSGLMLATMLISFLLLVQWLGQPQATLM